jgi:hypothetical protein
LEAARAYQGVVERFCQYKVEALIQLESVNNTILTPDYQSERVNTVSSLSCPGQCAPDGVKRGTCNNGACICDPGFGEVDCSFNFNASASITRIYPPWYDYQQLNQSNGIITMLVTGKNINRLGKLICNATVKRGYADPKLEPIYPSKFVSGMLVCYFRPTNIQPGKIYSILITITNDLVKYSNEVYFRMYDSNCMTCDQTIGNCTLKDGYFDSDGGCIQLLNQNCRCAKWTNHNNRYSPGGTLYSEVQTLDDCVSKCCDVQDCVAFDFDSTSSACWIHTNDVTDVLKQRTNGANWVQYLIYRNAACNGFSKLKWGIVKKSCSSDTVSYGTDTTLEECKLYCAGLPNCLAIDYYSDNQPYCWVSTDKKGYNKKRKIDACTEYTILKD